MATPRPLSTIGYEGKTIDEVLDELGDAKVTLLIDVRAVAASRRPGFSKTALAGALRARGISYLHLRALGTPKAGRDAARSGRIAEMHAIYEEQLETPEAELALAQAHEAATARHAALLCFERDAACCHRAIVADRLMAMGEYRRQDI
ncbi:DUF488 domain-containing protein [Sphingosinicella rhizophila]|uniref:DUF488 domain-containing protein n=1 Tax=Sphingosinicella rhizophila TaxID=3050082 RepID=A0ABU3Q8H2_9SPHN|nr:DUF488 domain-containing protein [Sphingosinicella sp. GR2756]MDT9599622.1 DUF488 domain-containing protein [Sphingosinicella sp. GR2756]